MHNTPAHRCPAAAALPQRLALTKTLFLDGGRTALPLARLRRSALLRSLSGATSAELQLEVLKDGLAHLQGTAALHALVLSAAPQLCALELTLPARLAGGVDRQGGGRASRTLERERCLLSSPQLPGRAACRAAAELTSTPASCSRCLQVPASLLRPHRAQRQIHALQVHDRGLVAALWRAALSASNALAWPLGCRSALASATSFLAACLLRRRVISPTCLPCLQRLL